METDEQHFPTPTTKTAEETGVVTNFAAQATDTCVYLFVCSVASFIHIYWAVASVLPSPLGWDSCCLFGKAQ
jgi:hypothetical protein